MNVSPVRPFPVSLRRPSDAFEIAYASDARPSTVALVRVGRSYLPEAAQRFAGGARIVVAQGTLPPLALRLAGALADRGAHRAGAAAAGVALDRVRELFEAVGAAPGEAAPITTLLLAVARWTNGPDDDRRRRRQDLTRRVFSYIDAHYAEPIRLREVARALGLAPAYLTDLVRRQTGQPVNQWIIERRLLEARRMLRSTDRAISDIAREVGFEDGGYFARLFRRRTGRAPAAWRDQGRASRATFGSAPGGSELYDALAALLHAASRVDVEDRAMEAVQRVLGMPLATCARRDAGTGVWTPRRRFAGGCSDSEPVSDTDQHVPLLLLGNAFVQDELADSFYSRLRALARAANVGTFAAAPFFVDGACVGGVAAFDANSRALSSGEIEMLESIAACAALRLTELVGSHEERESA